MKIYTKTGDKGQTSLIGGTRVAKNDVRLEAYGTVDELNSNVGLLAAMDISADNKTFLYQIQNLLFSVGSSLATDTTKTEYKAASVIKEEFITRVEKEIDRMDERLQPLSQFILPGGSIEAAQSHVCRTVARRAERRIIEMSENFPVDNLLIIYVNRLSDYFFALSRLLLLEKDKKEICWTPIV